MAKFEHEKTFASLPATSRGNFIVVNGDPKKKKFLYCNGSQIFIRDIHDTSICDIYTEHSKETTVAKYSPSGYYIASGDRSGKVRIWDTVNAEHILKNEVNVISGAIKDIDWTFDSNKICAVGEGREKFGRIFGYDTGSSVGDILGHSKPINNCAFKPTRPMKLVTVGEDFCAVFFEGPPFKFKCSKTDHTNFVNSVRYSPDGEIFITAGADGKMLIYDGKTSDFIEELGPPRAHKGGIYGICFKEDSKKLLSVSGDKTAKIWDLESKQVETEFVLGSQVCDMQVACLWQDDILLTVSLSGFINYLDPSNPSQPQKVVKGHNKPIVALSVSSDGAQIFSASSDGMIACWNSSTSDCEDFKGKGHSNQVNAIVIDGDHLVSVGMDDTIRFSTPSALQYGDACSLESQPKTVDSKEGVAVVGCSNHIVVMEAPGRKLSSLSINFEALSVSIHPGGTEVAIGTKSSIIFFNLNNGTLSEVKEKKISTPGEVSTVEYSPDGSWLAASFKRTVVIYETSTMEEKLEGWGEQHSAGVICLKWAPNSQRFVTGSIDAHMILWDVGKFKGPKPSVKAHAKSCVNQVAWLDNDRVVSAGQDSNIKLWKITQ